MYIKSISAVTKNQNFQLKEIFIDIKHCHMPEDLSDSNSNLILEFKVWVYCGGGLFCGLFHFFFYFEGEVLTIFIWVCVVFTFFKVLWKICRSRDQSKKKIYFLFYKPFGP